ncbi:Multidrug resistance-associated protein 6, partial [Coemansia sp. RSA 522]
AIYNDADVYILDDVLSAVDTQVKDHLIKHVLAETGILNNKTRILVTHADHVVPLSDMNIIVDMGNVV